MIFDLQDMLNEGVGLIYMERETPSLRINKLQQKVKEVLCISIPLSFRIRKSVSLVGSIGERTNQPSPRDDSVAPIAYAGRETMGH